MKKKKIAEVSDPHIREAHLAETFEKHSEPAITPLSPTAVPSQLIAPIQHPSLPSATETSVSQKKKTIEPSKK